MHGPLIVKCSYFVDVWRSVWRFVLMFCSDGRTFFYGSMTSLDVRVTKVIILQTSTNEAVTKYFWNITACILLLQSGACTNGQPAAEWLPHDNGPLPCYNSVIRSTPQSAGTGSDHASPSFWPCCSYRQSPCRWLQPSSRNAVVLRVKYPASNSNG